MACFSLSYNSLRGNLLLYFFITSLILYVSPWYKFLGWGEVVDVIAPCGKVKGTLSTTRFGRKIAAFTGIPYGKPPIGDLRFKRPEPIQEQKDRVIDATRMGPSCFQPTDFGYEGQEDCLILNVYTSVVDYKKKMGKLLPVMVFVHGGSFMKGSSAIFSPAHLLDRNIVLVTINYRLGPLGFLNLGGKKGQSGEIPSGNQGLWDQRLALTWVQKNIAAFGGDPKQVTFSGSSAGGLSVLYHLISPGSKGLFQKAIIQSGAAIGPLTNALRRHGDLVQYHRRYASASGCSDEDPANMADCLRNLPVKRLYDDAVNVNLLVPWIGSKSSSNPFFKGDVLEAVRKGQIMKNVPVMMGSVNGEGLLLSSYFLRNPGEYEDFKSRWSSSGPMTLFGLRGDEVTPDVLEAANEVKAFYFGKDVDMDIDRGFLNLTNMLGDAFVTFGTDLTMELWSNSSMTNPLYYYRYYTPSQFSICDIIHQPWYQQLWNSLMMRTGRFKSSNLGVCHGDELLALYKLNNGLMVPDVSISHPLDVKHSNMTIDLFVNFASFGKPIPSFSSMAMIESQLSNDTLVSLPKRIWARYGKGKKEFFDNRYSQINKHYVVPFADKPFDERMQFWRDLEAKYNLFHLFR